MKIGKEWIDNEIKKLRTTGDQLPTGRIDLISGDFFKGTIGSQKLASTLMVDVICHYAKLS